MCFKIIFMFFISGWLKWKKERKKKERRKERKKAKSERKKYSGHDWVIRLYLRLRKFYASHFMGQILAFSDTIC